MKSIVISLGGSVLLSEDIDRKYYKKLESTIEKISEKYKIFIVVGGGRTARTYIKLGRSIGLNEKTLDELGIEATRINALFLSKLVTLSNKRVPCTTDEAIKIDDKIVIMGGTSPGHSTDMVGAELAEKVNAVKYVIATNVDGIYDSDPNNNVNAKKIEKISIKQLIETYGTEWNDAGKNIVIDGPALKIISKAKIPTFVLNGKKLDELENVVFNKKFNGTVIGI